MSFMVVPLLSLLLFYHIPNTSFAQVFVGPVSEGSGGASVAGVEVNEILFSNPAVIAHARGSSLGLYHSIGAFHTGDRVIWAASVVDNHTGAFLPAGLGYVRSKGRIFSREFKEELVELALGNFVSGQFALGMGLKWLRQEVAESVDRSYWNLNLGLHWNPLPVLGLGLAYHNPFRGQGRYVGRSLNSEVTAGVLFLPYDFIRLRLNLSYMDEPSVYFGEGEEQGLESRELSEQNFGFQLGLESSLHRSITVRLGYRNKASLEITSVGMSLITPRFTIDYSLSKALGSGQELVHNVGLRIP